MTGLLNVILKRFQLLIKVKLLNLKNIAAFGKVKWLGAWWVLPQK